MKILILFCMNVLEINEQLNEMKKSFEEKFSKIFLFFRLYIIFSFNFFFFFFLLNFKETYRNIKQNKLLKTFYFKKKF